MEPVKIRDDVYWIRALDLVSGSNLKFKVLEPEARTTFVPTAEDLESCRQLSEG